MLGSSAALTSDEIALFSKTGNRTETEISKPTADALFKQFQVGRPRKTQEFLSNSPPEIIFRHEL